MSTRHLIERFGEAGLELVAASAPFVMGATDVFQLDIRRRRAYDARSGGASIVRFTRGTTRHMLVGRDERQLFMCRLPRACTTVSQAHDALRAPSVKPARSAIERPIRQGEWFFVALDRDERDALDAAMVGRRAFVRSKVSIGSVIPRAGKPHVADELVVVRGDGDEREVFVRGAVRHADHKTIHLGHWRRVHRNNEVQEQQPTPFGGTWID